jgi:hypothetical protein
MLRSQRIYSVRLPVGLLLQEKAQFTTARCHVNKPQAVVSSLFTITLVYLGWHLAVSHFHNVIYYGTVLYDA